jgi:hypothetical protein
MLSSIATATSSTAFTNKTGNISQWTNDAGYSTSDAYVSNVSLSGSDLIFTGYNGGFNGTIALPGGSTDYVSNVTFLGSTLTFTGVGSAFNSIATGIAGLASDNAFTGYNTISKSRSGSALYISNVNGLGTGINSNGGYLGVDANGATYDLELGTSGKMMISTFAAAPASATAGGTKGTVIITATYIYVCSATNTWVRTALSTW